MYVGRAEPISYLSLSLSHTHTYQVRYDATKHEEKKKEKEEKRAFSIFCFDSQFTRSLSHTYARTHTRTPHLRELTLEYLFLGRLPFPRRWKKKIILRGKILGKRTMDAIK